MHTNYTFNLITIVNQNSFQSQLILEGVDNHQQHSQTNKVTYTHVSKMHMLIDKKKKPKSNRIQYNIKFNSKKKIENIASTKEMLTKSNRKNKLFLKKKQKNS